MCIEVHYAEIGPADAALDLNEKILVLRPGHTIDDDRRGIAGVLRAVGVEQIGDAPTCVCGDRIPIPEQRQAS